MGSNGQGVSHNRDSQSGTRDVSICCQAKGEFLGCRHRVFFSVNTVHLRIPQRVSLVWYKLLCHDWHPDSDREQITTAQVLSGMVCLMEQRWRDAYPASSFQSLPLSIRGTFRSPFVSLLVPSFNADQNREWKGIHCHPFQPFWRMDLLLAAAGWGEQLGEGCEQGADAAHDYQRESLVWQRCRVLSIRFADRSGRIGEEVRYALNSRECLHPLHVSEKQVHWKFIRCYHSRRRNGTFQINSTHRVASLSFLSFFVLLLAFLSLIASSTHRLPLVDCEREDAICISHLFLIWISCCSQALSFFLFLSLKREMDCITCCW